MTRRLGLLAVFVLLLAACASSGAPEGFDEQPGPINAEWRSALGSGVDAQAVPLVQRNFLEGCITIDPTKRYQDLQLNEVGLISVCGCGYDGIVETLLENSQLEGETQEERENDAFDRFKKLDDKLGDPDKELDDWVDNIFRSCIASESSL